MYDCVFECDVNICSLVLCAFVGADCVCLRFLILNVNVCLRVLCVFVGGATLDCIRLFVVYIK